MSNNKPNHLELAKICKATYAGPINHKILSYDGLIIDQQKIIHGSYGRGFCRVFWNPETVIFAFRGTRESVDWKTSNLKMFPVQLKNCGTSSRGIKVRRGFQKTLYYPDKTTKLTSIDAVFKHIEELDLFNGRKVVITGHSLGGALAILFATKLRLKFPEYINANLIKIVVFGSPAVGLKKFKTFYGDLNNKTIRIINGSDIVPFTPPLFYHHIGSDIWYNSRSTKSNNDWFTRLSYALRLPLKKFIRDHSMDSYIESLERNTADTI